MSRTPCPTPTKFRHRSKWAAQLHLYGEWARSGFDENLHAYECPSGGHWHIGHRRRQHYAGKGRR